MNKNEPVAAYRRVPLFLVDGSGNGVSGLTWSTPPASGEVLVSQAGATSANAAGSVHADGAGRYYYEFTQSETNFDGGYLLVDVAAKGAARRYVVEVPLVRPGVSLSDIPTVSAIASGILTAVVDSTSSPASTIRGVLARLDALARGKAQGLKGAIAEFFLGDGTTHALQAVQDVDAGTRAAATDVHGD